MKQDILNGYNYNHYFGFGDLRYGISNKKGSTAVNQSGIHGWQQLVSRKNLKQKMLPSEDSAGSNCVSTSCEFGVSESSTFQKSE